MPESQNFFYIRIFKLALAGFDLINDLRLHVILNYFLVTSWFMHSSGVFVESSVEYAGLMSLMAGFAYLLNRYTDYSYDLIVDKDLKKAPRWLYLTIGLTALFVAIYFAFLAPVYFLPLIFGAIFGLLYSVKTFFKYPIKNYLITKNLFAAFSKYVIVMWGVLLFLPATELLFIRSFSILCIYYIYEVLWDIRDMNSDKIGNVSTIPNVFGKTYAVVLSAIVLFFSFSVQYPFVNRTDHFFIKYAAVMFFIVCFFFVKNVRWYHFTTYTHIVINLLFVSDSIIRYFVYLLSILEWNLFFLYMQYFTKII